MTDSNFIRKALLKVERWCGKPCPYLRFGCYSVLEYGFLVSCVGTL